MKMNSKTFEILQFIKEQCIQTTKDYKNGYIEYDFLVGVIVGLQVLLDEISRIYDVDLSEYEVELIKKDEVKYA